MRLALKRLRSSKVKWEISNGHPLSYRKQLHIQSLIKTIYLQWNVKVTIPYIPASPLINPFPAQNRTPAVRDVFGSLCVAIGRASGKVILDFLRLFFFKGPRLFSMFPLFASLLRTMSDSDFNDLIGLFSVPIKKTCWNYWNLLKLTHLQLQLFEAEVNPLMHNVPKWSDTL